MAHMNTSPDPRRIFLSLAARKLTWKAALAELIDNSIDAGATRVEIVHARPHIEIRDNGCGATHEGIEKMLTYGGHLESRSTVIGRHGIGMKDAAAWIGSPISIETIHGGSYMRVRRDWYRDASTSFEVPDPVAVTDEALARTGLDARGGTLIRVKLKTGRRFPNKAEFERLVSELGFLYTPRLRQGFQLSVTSGKRQHLAEAYVMPERTEVIEKVVHVSTRKSLRINVGVVGEGVPNPKPGIAYYYGPRVIQHGSMGCGMFGIRDIAGTVEMIGDWRLGAHKDDLCEDAQDASDAVYAQIHGLLEHAATRGAELSLIGLSESLSKSLTDAFSSGGMGAKGRGRRRGRGDGSGQAPTPGEGSGGPGHGPGGRAARRKTDGKSPFGREPRIVAVDFAPRDDDRLAVVDWSLDNSVKVTLAENHPFIARWTRGDDAAHEATLQAICVSALCDYMTHEDGAQRRLPGMTDRLGHEAYGAILWRLLDSGPMDDGDGAVRGVQS